MNVKSSYSAHLSRWISHRLRFGIITLAIIGLTASLVPANSAPAEAVLTTEGTPPSAAANAASSDEDLCNAPWGRRIPVLKDNEIMFETDDSVNTYPGTLVDSAFADLNGDAKATPVRVMRQSRLTGTGGVHVVAFEDQKSVATFIDEQSTTGAPYDLAIAEGDVITPDDENYPRDEIVYASLYGPSRDEPAAFADVHLLGEELDADGYIRIQLDREISDNFYNVRIYLETGDFDGDGDEDIVVAVHHPQYGIWLHVLEFESGYTRGAGQSSLREVDAQKISPDEHTSVSFGVGDIDRDYRDELVVTTVQETYSDGPYQGYVGTSSYALSSQGSFFEHARAEGRGLRKVGPVHVAVGDVNGDTFADVVTVSDDANPSGSGTDREVVAWSFGEDPNLIAGRFPSLAKYQQAKKSFPLDMQPLVNQVWSTAQSESIFDVQVGDVDQDGLDEVIIGTEDGSSAGYSRLQSQPESVRSHTNFFESVEMPDRSQADSTPLMSLADVDGDSISATLGAGTFELPTCNDTVNPDFTMETNLPPQWTGITKQGLEEGSRFLQLGTQESNGVSKTGGITTISGDSFDWASRLTVEVEAGPVYFAAWLEYRGSNTYTHEAEDSWADQTTVTTNYGVYAENNELVRVDVPMRCYNYSVYKRLAPAFEPARVGEISTEDKAIPLAGSSFGSVEGLVRRCAINESESSMAAADTPDGTEESNSLYGSKPMDIDSQYAVIRPDWSSMAMFMGHRTSQSSRGETSGFAVDGLLSRGKDPAPVARTAREDQPWWQIDLGEPRRVSSVRVLAGGELRNFGVMLSNEDFSTMPESSDPVKLSQRSDVKAFVWNRAISGDFSIATSDGNAPMTARYIRVQRAEDDVELALTEVQVFGDSQIDPSAYPADLIAPPEPELELEEPKKPADPNAIYQVKMWDRYENTFKWVDQRGDMFANFGESKYKWNNPAVKRGSAGISFDWAKEFETAFEHSDTHETVTSHGWGNGTAGGLIVKDFAFSNQINAYLEVSHGRDWFGGDAKSKGTGTTIGKGINYFEAMSGWDPHPEGTLLADGTSAFAQYPAVCEFTFTPNISTRFQAANSGYRHSYLSVDYIVNETGTLAFKRSDPRSRVCSLGTYRVEARNVAPTAPDFTVYTRPGVPLDMDVLSEAMDEFSAPGTGVQLDGMNCSVGYEPEPKHAADCNEHQKLAIYGIDKMSGSGELELVNPGRLNVATNSSESLIRYTPTDQDESAVLEYTVTDGEAQATGHITVEVEAEPPTANPFKISTVVGEPQVVDVLGHTEDPAGLALTVTKVENGEHTTVEIEDGVVTATSSELGADTFTYTVSNGRKTATAEIEVESMLGQAVSGTVGVEQTLEIPTEELGIVGQEFTISKVEPGDHTIVTHHDGVMKLRPHTAEEDSFTYTIDAGGVERTVLVRVSAMHRKGWSAFEDIEAELGEVSFAKSSAAAALPRVIANPESGNGAYTKWPKTVVGPDGTVVSQILFRDVDFGDGEGQLRLVGKSVPGSGRGDVILGIGGVNGAPHRAVATWFVGEGDEVSVDLPENFTGVQNVRLAASGSQAEIGMLLDSFTFERGQAGDPGDPNDDVLPPTANDVEIEDAVVGQTATVDLKQYFSDPAGLPVSVVDVGSANNSLVVLGDDGVLTVTPWRAGSESFSYTVSNGTKTATATITVQAEPAAPDSLQQSVTGTVGMEQTLDVPVGELGIAGKEYTITEVTPAEHTHVVNENGALRIRPLASGEDVFTYTVAAGEQETTVTVTVSAESKTPWNPFERMEVESAGIDCPMTNLVCPHVAMGSEFSNGAILKGLARGGRVEFKNVDFGSDAGSLKLIGKFASFMRGDPVLTVVGVGAAGWNYDDEAAEFSLPLKTAFSNLPENLTGVHDLIIEFRGVDVGKSVSLDFVQFERTASESEPEPEVVKQTVTGTVGMEQTMNVPVADLGFTGQDMTITEVSTAGHTTVVNDGDSLTVRPLGPGADSFTYTVSAGGVEKTVNVTVTATHRTGWSAFEDIEAELGTVACIETYNPSVCPVVASHPDSSNGAHLTWPSGSQLPWIQFGDVDFGDGQGKLRFHGTAAPGSGSGKLDIKVDFDGVVRYATTWQVSGDGEYVVDLDGIDVPNITGVHNVNILSTSSSSAEPVLLDSFKFQRLPVEAEVEAPSAPNIEIDDAVVGQGSTLDLADYISDPADLPLTVDAVGNAQHSLVTRDGKVLTVTPLQLGSDFFTYTVSNGTKTATGTVTVRASAPLPEALEQSVTGTVGMEQSLEVPLEELRIAGQEYAITGITPAEHTHAANKDGAISIRPLAPGEDSFTYTIAVGGQETTVTVNVSAEYRIGWSAFERIEVETGRVECPPVNSGCPTVKVDDESSNGAYVGWGFGGALLPLPSLKMQEVDFGSDEGRLRLRVASSTESGTGAVEIRIDGRPVGKWDPQEEPEFWFDLEANIVGVHDVTLVPQRSNAPRLSLDYIQFERDAGPEAPEVAQQAVTGTVGVEQTLVVPVEELGIAGQEFTITEVTSAEHTNLVNENGVIKLRPLGPDADTFTYAVVAGEAEQTVQVTVTAEHRTGWNAFETIEAELGEVSCGGKYDSSVCPVVAVDPRSGNGAHLAWPNGTRISSVIFKDVDFGDDEGQLRFHGKSSTGSASGEILVGVDLDGVTHSVVASWLPGGDGEFSVDLGANIPNITGVHSVRLVSLTLFDPGKMLVDSFRFERLPVTDPEIEGPLARAVDVNDAIVGQTSTVDLKDYISDPADRPLTVVGVGSANNSLVELAVDGMLTVTPWQAGTESFSYTVSNGVKTATGTITVHAINPAPEVAPTAHPDAIDTVVGVPKVVDVLENDTPDDGSLTITNVTDGAHTTVVLQDGVVTVTSSEPGADSFTYTISDGEKTATGTVTVTATAREVEPEVGVPTANRDQTTTVVGVPKVVEVLKNDTDPADLPLTVTDVTDGTHTTVVLENGVVTATSTEVGEDSFTYTVSNGTKTATAEVRVTAMLAQVVSGTVGMEQTLDVPIDDLGIMGQGYAITRITQAEHTDIVRANGAISVRPLGPDSDTFTYTVVAGGVEKTVRVTVNAQHRTGWSAFETIEIELGEVSCKTHYDSAVCPVIVSDASSSNGAHTIWPNGMDHPSSEFKGVDFGDGEGKLRFRGKAAPGSGGGEVLVGVDLDGVVHGVVATWTPADGSEFSVDLGENIPNITGVHSVRLISMGSLDTRKMLLDSFTFERAGVEEPPVLPPNAVDDNMGDVVVGEATIWDVLGNDWDPAGLPLTISEVTDGEHTTVVLSDNKIVATALEAGSDSFTYTVTNGTTSATATVTLTAVNPVPVVEAPTANTFGIDTVVGVPKVVDVLKHANDPADLPLTIAGVTNGEHTTVVLKDGVVTATSAEKGTDTFTYTVSNGVKTATGTVTVRATTAPTAPQAPIALDDRIDDAIVGKVITVDVLLNDSDPADLPLTVTDVDQGRHSLVVLEDGVVTVTPLQAGDDTFTYTVSNGVLSATATVWVTANSGQVDPSDPDPTELMCENPYGPEVLNESIQLDGNGKYVVEGSALRLTSSCVNVHFFVGTTLTGPAGATISVLPPVQTLTLEQMGKIDADVDANAIVAVKVGAPGGEITIDPFGAWVVIKGAAGKDVVGFFREGSDTPFERIAVECSQKSALGLGPKTDCYTDSGDDLLIWTHHFTTFVGYDLAKSGQVGSVIPGQATPGHALQGRLSTTGVTGQGTMAVAGVLILLFGGAVLLLAMRGQRSPRGGRHGA